MKPNPDLEPRPLCVVSVGVTGHRWNKLAHDQRARIQAQLDLAFAAIAGAGADVRTQSKIFYDDEPTVLRCLSALAEGADRMAAKAALGAGFALHAPLPFLPDRYEADFADAASQEAFRDWLGQCERVTALDGAALTAGDPGSAAPYAAVGDILARASDILIAVWDGGSAAGPGGTAEVVEHVRGLAKPVLWINASDERPIRLLSEAGDMDLRDLAQARREVFHALDPFYAPPQDPWSRRRLRAFLEEPAPDPMLAPETPPTEVFAASAAVGPQLVARFQDVLAPRLAFVRRAAERLARRDRRSRAWVAALPPAIGVFALGAALSQTTFAGVLALIAALCCLGLVAQVASEGLRRSRFHAAERDRLFQRLSVMPGLAMIGADASDDQRGPSSTWIEWYARATRRELGLPDAQMDLVWRSEAARSLRDRLIREGAAASRLLAARLLQERQDLTRLALALAGLAAVAAIWSFFAIVIGAPPSDEALVGYGFAALAAAGGASTVWALRNSRDPAAVEEAEHRARQLEATAVRSFGATAPGAPPPAARNPATLEEAIRAACAEL